MSEIIGEKRKLKHVEESPKMLFLFVIQSPVLTSLYKADASYVGICKISEFYSVTYNLLQLLTPPPPTSESPSISFISKPFCGDVGEKNILSKLSSALFSDSVGNNHIYLCSPKKLESMINVLIDDIRA
jgi:hypothetical protein